MHRVWARKKDNDDQFESVYHFNHFFLLKALYLFVACCSGVKILHVIVCLQNPISQGSYFQTPVQ